MTSASWKLLRYRKASVAGNGNLQFFLQGEAELKIGEAAHLIVVSLREVCTDGGACRYLDAVFRREGVALKPCGVLFGYGSPRTQIFSNSRIDFFCNGMTSTSETGMSFAYDAPNYNFRPTLNDTVNLGSSAYKWKCVYAVNGTIQTSDRRYKRDINALDERYEVLSQLICAKSFIMDIVDERRRIGYIAQELEALVRSVGLSVDECSFINKDWIERKDYTGWEYSLDYTQINTMRIESIQKQINELKVEIATLKAAN